MSQEEGIEGTDRGTDLYRGNKRDQVVQRSGTNCFFCSTTLNRVRGEVDHLIPVSQGGRTTLDNGQLVCSGCNRSKGSQTPSQYFKQMGQPAKCIQYTGKGGDGRCGKSVASGKGNYCSSHKN